MMNRSLVYVVGLGPGGAQYLTAQAQTALQAADVLCGYTVYIDLVRPLYPDKEVYATGMTRELDRCRWALETAKGGKTVALVCSGDAGVYGMASPLLELAEHCPEVEVEIVQSNHEGAIVDAIQAAYQEKDGIVINPAAYTHTSVAILDALKAVGLPAVEVHLSNIYEREKFRHISYPGMACVKTFYGHGFAGYEMAIQYLKNLLSKGTEDQ